MKTVELKAQKRSELKTNKSKKLRTKGLVPSVLYGGQEEPLALTVNLSEIKKSFHVGHSQNVILDLKIEDGGKTESIKAISYQIETHPVSDEIIHIDFLRVFENAPVKVTVQVDFVGSAPGLKMGGTLAKKLNQLSISCLPNEIPEVLNIDISKLKLGERIRIKDIKAITPFTVFGPDNEVIVQIQSQRGKAVTGGEEESSEDA